MKIAQSAFLAIGLAVLSGTAQAGTITSQTFDTDPVLGSSQAAGTWYTDRYAPAGFSSQDFMGDSRLVLELSEDDAQGNRTSSYSSAFYNTQGRKYDTDGATSVSVEMYIDSAWQNDASRIAGIWGSAIDAASAISSYPIIEFANGGFQVYSNGVFTSVAATFAYDAFAKLEIALSGAFFDIFINDDKVLSFDSNGSTSIANAILQGYNTGVERTIYFDNFVASTPAEVPLPAGLPLLISALGAAGLVARRKKAA